MFTICLQFGHTLFTTDLYNVLKDKGKGYLKRVLRANNMKKYIELNNETFEVKKAKSELHPLEYRALVDCYTKPSEIKCSIWKRWIDWLVQLDKNSSDIWFGSLTIISYNCMMFTLGCNVYNNVNKLIGQLYITKTRQEFWTI